MYYSYHNLNAYAQPLIIVRQVFFNITVLLYANTTCDPVQLFRFNICMSVSFIEGVSMCQDTHPK